MLQRIRRSFFATFCQTIGSMMNESPTKMARTTFTKNVEILNRPHPAMVKVVVVAQPGIDFVRAVMEACKPGE